MAPNQHYLRSMVSMVNTQSMTTPKRCCCWWWWWWWWCFPFGLGNPNLTNPQILRCLYPDVPPFTLPVSRYSTDFQVSSICDINWTCIPRKAWSCACRCIFRSFLGTPNPTMGGHWSFFLLSWPRSTIDHNKDFQTLPTVLDDWWFCESQDWQNRFDALNSPDRFWGTSQKTDLTAGFRAQPGQCSEPFSSRGAARRSGLGVLFWAVVTKIWWNHKTQS